jgi:hypothetical protein
MERRKNCFAERENAFFKSSPEDEYHLPKMNSEKVFFGVWTPTVVNLVGVCPKNIYVSNFLTETYLLCRFEVEIFLSKLIRNNSHANNFMAIFFRLGRISLK